MYRQRMNCKVRKIDKEPVNKLMLNELFLAEKDVSKTATYKVQADGADVGRFRSSGILVSTGTGSSGWLYGAKRVTVNNVLDIAKELYALEDKENTENVEILQQLIKGQTADKMADIMSRDTHFSAEAQNMYYFVREPYCDTHKSEGFAKHILLTSEMTDGLICIDGQTKFDLEYGETCEIDFLPEHQLKCIKF